MKPVKLTPAEKFYLADALSRLQAAQKIAAERGAQVLSDHDCNSEEWILDVAKGLIIPKTISEEQGEEDG